MTNIEKEFGDLFWNIIFTPPMMWGGMICDVIDNTDTRLKKLEDVIAFYGSNFNPRLELYAKKMYKESKEGWYFSRNRYGIQQHHDIVKASCYGWLAGITNNDYCADINSINFN